MYRMKQAKYLICSTIALLLVSQMAVSQASDYAFRHYTTDQGLSSDQTTCIFKDKQGYMWFGTVNGLNRFDGIEFKVYKRSMGGLPGNYIIGLNQSPDGWLWISTHRGICRFNTITEIFEQISLPTQKDERGDNDFVSGMVFDKRGNGWFASADHLYRINLQTKQLTAYPGTSQDAHPQLMYLFADSKGSLWVMRAGALYRFEKGTYTYILGQDSQHLNSSVHVVSLYEDSKQELWATTFEKGLMRYDAQQNCFVDEPDKNITINAVVEDWRPNGQSFFWAGTGEALAIYDLASQQYNVYEQDARDRLSHNGGDVIQLFRDPQTGIIWMATNRGIQKADPYEIKFKRKLLPVQPGFKHNSEVSVVRQDLDNPAIYWIGLAGGGFIQWDRQTNTYTHIGVKESISNSVIYDIRPDNKGNLWLATENGLYCWNPKQNHWKHWKNFYISHDGYHTITTVYPDKNGYIWIGSGQDGVFVINPETDTIQPWSLGEDLNTGNPLRVSKFEEDTYGQIWVSTTQGIFRIQASRNRTDKITLSSPEKHIQPSDRLQSTLKIDSKNHLWVSGIGFLAQADLNGKVLKTYTQENGLQADHIFSIEEDDSGMLWMVTDYLLHQLNPQTGDFTYFRKENGLYANNTVNSISKDANGELFIGFTGAFNHFIPGQLLYSQTPPPVVLTGVKVDNKKRLPGADQKIEIGPSENTFSVDFAVLHYSLPEKSQYSYNLEGFDHDWTYTESRSATYTNMPPGNYIFRVKAANSDGIWNEQGAALLIHVIPHYYQTWWFRLLITALATVIVYAFYRYREINRLRLESIRNRIATDLHDDMGSTLSSIRIFSDLVQRQIAPVQPESVPILQRISSSATALSESMQDIIWTIQTKYDSLEDVVARMREFGLKMAEAKEIDFRMQVSEKFQSTRLHVEQRRNLYLIFKESINNAVKYADSTKLTVNLEVSGRMLSLYITDNGKGFDPATIRQGNGLQSLHKRATEIKGQLAIYSTPGAGTRIELHMKLTS